MPTSELHVLKQLQLPDRYENLRSLLGERVAELVVEPSAEALQELRRAAEAIRARREGAYLPLMGPSGAGKTTLANSLNVFLPAAFAPTVPYSGPVDFDAMNKVLEHAVSRLRANDDRVMPLNFDHRESAPPDAKELATIKRFLRAPSLGARCIVVWPEVSQEIAREISSAYEAVAGRPAFNIPVEASGPAPETWPAIATHTLELVNQVPSLEDLGIAPENYDPSAYETLGAYLRDISNDFVRLRDEMIASTIKPMTLVVLYASESHNAGVLAQLTSGAKYGLLDSQALLAATPKSVIGRWWGKRRGLLTQTILKLNARAFCMPPAAAVAILRAYGSEETSSDLEALGVTRHGPARVAQYISRTDLGKFLAGAEAAAYEARGRPPEDARAAFAALAEKGLTTGRDKALNAAMAEGLKVFLHRSEIPYEEVGSEQQLSFVALIPDVRIERSGDVGCIEFAWRSGQFLDTSTRSEVAQYGLTKLKSYAVALGWAT